MSVTTRNITYLVCVSLLLRMVFLQAAGKKTQGGCQPGFRRCNRMTCISEKLFCDGSDGKSCRRQIFLPPSKYLWGYFPEGPCPYDYLFCDGKCYTLYFYKCDGAIDCSDGRDEEDCDFFNLHSNRYMFNKATWTGGGQVITMRSTRASAAVISTSTTTTNSPRMTCDQGYTVVHDRCIRVTTHPPESWKWAKQTCQKEGSALVEIDNREFFVALQNHLNNTEYQPYSYWTGANDLAHEDQRKWNHSSLPIHLDAPLWTYAKKNLELTSARAHNCGLLENGNFRYMNDGRCEKKNPFICQMGPKRYIPRH